MSQDILYRLSYVRKTYETSEEGSSALDIVGLEIPNHKVIAILGPSGSGKTTLLNILGLLDTPDNAPYGASNTPMIRFYGTQSGPLTSPEQGFDLVADRKYLLRWRKQIFGFVFQDSYLLKNLSGQSNIIIPLFINGFAPTQSPIDQYLARVGLPSHEYASRLPTELSGGQAQRVAIIRAVVHNPKVLLADEPSSRLDQDQGWQIMRSLVDWCHDGDGRTLIWVTHNLEQAAKLADHVIFLRDGKVVICADNVDHDEATLVRWSRTGATQTVQTSLQEEGVTEVTHHEPTTSAPASNDAEAKAMWRDIQPVPAAYPRGNLAQFIVHFALADIFPPIQQKTTIGSCAYIHKAMRLLRSAWGIRHTQGLNVLSLYMVLLLALFFSHICFWLNNYFIWSVSDPRINNITVNGKKHGDPVLSHEDMEQLATLSWVYDSAQSREIISWGEQIKAKGLTFKRPAIIGAYGSRNRPLDFYFVQGSRWGENFTNLSLGVMHAKDPILAHVRLLEGKNFAELTPSGKRLRALLEESGGRTASGLVMTRASLEKDLGYAGGIPETVLVNLHSAQRHLPLLGISDWLPFGAEVLVSEDWYEKNFYESLLGDRLPGYDRITIYIKDMLRDGLPLSDILLSLDYRTMGEVKSLLTWITNLTDFIFLTGSLAVLGMSVLVTGTLVVSYTQAIRKKQREIGVLLAHGIPKIVLYLTFLCEILIIWAIAVVLVWPTHKAGSWFFRQLMTEHFVLQSSAAQIFSIPAAVYPVVYGGSLTLAMLAVLWAVRWTIRGNIAEILKTAE